MNKLILFILLIFIFGCGDTQKKKTMTLADTSSSTNNDHVESIQKDSIKPAPKKIKKPEELVQNEINAEFIQKAIVYRRDSSLNIFGNIRADYRIFGYQKADTNSRKLLLVSVFTSDVKDNPYRCEYGAYYSSSDIENTRLKYVRKTGDFIEANLIKNGVILTPIFFQKNWVEFKD
ncbi:hypothetical protein H9X96_04130 [Pedobacter sp. N36a]|uniref:hypothetical protein n=1 Tax=Pedobacter sp. N36a TaxID=2767996 RepID=UPI001656935D|nr:hypothetical protein [Pedobacter sp. N36a]MBC8984959.1 hypothetical protein [Pedobacter sp. N36a]